MANTKDIQTELNLDNLADAPELNAPAQEQNAPEVKATGGYTPKPAVIERLNKMPKAEIKDRYGIDIDYLIRSEKRYGVLEALAYGDQTPRPVSIAIRVPGAPSITGKATVRLKYAYYDKEGQPKMYMDNIHHVSYKYDVDDKGNVLKDENGKPKMVLDRNPIKEGDIVKWGGKELTKAQTDALRLTGHLGEAINDVDANGVPSQIILSVDPYNNHELVSVDSAYVAKTLKANPEFKKKNADGEVVAYPITPRMIGELSLGRGVWLGDEARGKCFVQYNAATRRLERATSFKNALNKELEQKEKTREAKAAAKTAAENVKVGQKL